MMHIDYIYCSKTLCLYIKFVVWFIKKCYESGYSETYLECMAFDFWSRRIHDSVAPVRFSSCSVIPAVRLRCHLYRACESSQLFFCWQKDTWPWPTSLSKCVVEYTTRVGCIAPSQKKRECIITIICIAACTLVTTGLQYFSLWSVQRLSDY
jgi:hypothetical protein